MLYDLLLFGAVSALALMFASAWGQRSKFPFPARLLLVAVALRILGSTIRYEVIFRVYRGLGDAVRYYNEGMDFARALRGFPPLAFSVDFWFASSRWWGTQFLERVSGVVLAVIGPSMRAEFVIFALIAFAGIYAIAIALRNVQPGEAAHLRFATWMWLWPSLWFWPSSVGKEAILMLAIGLTVLGFAGRNQAVRWIPFLAGLGLSFCIRPHVTAALALAAMAAYWLGSWKRFRFRHVLEAILAIGLAFFALQGMLAQFGLQDVDLEGVQEFVEFHSDQTLQGGSNIGAAPVSAVGVPVAFVNVWVRPFPWEAHNLNSMFAALEMLVFWGLVWRRREAVKVALKHWRRHRLLRFAIPLLIVYTLMIGLAFGNLGIIARQRAPMFPFMLMLATVAPGPRVARASRPAALAPDPARRAA